MWKEALLDVADQRGQVSRAVQEGDEKGRKDGQ